MRLEFNDGLEKDAIGAITDKNFVEGVHYNYYKSSASCNLDDIKGIVFGGLSARFWMCRKHMNVNHTYMCKMRRPPFYSWECITLQLVNREVDLVIQNEKDMDDLIEVLVDGMNTVDGNKDSYDAVDEAIRKEKIKQELKKRG